MSAVISLHNVRKSFDGGSEFILNGINLEILKGKLTTIIGFSGTGKSVMLKHILGLLSPTSGDIFVLGHRLTDLSLKELIQLRCRIGVLFQHAALFDDMTVLENVSFPLYEHRPEMSHSDISEVAHNKLMISGMEEKHFMKIPSELSGGMRKRVGLARALALDPEVLIYDEPTTGLDPIFTEMVDNLILETHKKHSGSTALVVSHDLMSSFRISDWIIMLDQGKVLLSGEPSVFLNSDHELVQKFVEKGVKRK